MTVLRDQAEPIFHESPIEPIGDRTRIHAWLLDLDDEPRSGRLDPSVLSEVERQATEAFRDPRLRRRSIAARLYVRQILGKCLDAAPGEISFSANAHGKPHVVAPASRGEARAILDFNLSHSENVLLVGVSFDAQIGVDLEIIQPSFDAPAVAASHFTAAENAQINALPDELRQAAFFRCWTLKEAALKALGVGLAAGLDCVELNIDDSGVPRIVGVQGKGVPLGTWSWFQQTFAFGPLSAATAIVTAG